MGATALMTMWKMVLIQGGTFFKKISEPPENSRCQESSMNQVPYWRPTNSVRHQYKIWSPRQAATQDLCAHSPVKFLLCLVTVIWLTLSTHCIEVVYYLYISGVRDWFNLKTESLHRSSVQVYYIHVDHVRAYALLEHGTRCCFLSCFL